jgi:hypothetical protein
MRYRSAQGWNTTVETVLKARKSRLAGSRDTFCYGNAVATNVAYDDGTLVVSFHAPTGCQMPQYRFDPVTGVGKILMSSDNGATWAEGPGSTASITLIK